MTVTSRCHSWPRSWASSQQTLRTWRRQTQVDSGEREGLTSEQLEELRRLRRENRTLQMEREVLKKAAVFFARESKR